MSDILDYVIPAETPAYQLGVESMDSTHQEFISLVNRLAFADKADFPGIFQTLLEHTQKHFDDELKLMQLCGFPAIREHTDDHQRVLGELNYMAKRVNKGNTLFARAYVREKLPSWFHVHAQTMDSALAAYVKLAGVSA